MPNAVKSRRRSRARFTGDSSRLELSSVPRIMVPVLPPFPHPLQLGRLRIGQPSSGARGDRWASSPRRETEPVETHPPMTQDDPNVIQPGRDPTTFTGVAISPGVGMGPAWLVVDLLKPAPDPPAIARDQIAGEWRRIPTSFEQTRRDAEDSDPRIEV